MSDISAVKALVFDVFGTVVDWRTSLIADFSKWSETRGIKADWTALVDGWRAVYSASMDEVRKHPERGYMILDTLHRQSLEKLVSQMSIQGLTDGGTYKVQVVDGTTFKLLNTGNGQLVPISQGAALGRREGVGQQERDGHRPDAARDGG